MLLLKLKLQLLLLLLLLSSGGVLGPDPEIANTREIAAEFEQFTETQHNPLRWQELRHLVAHTYECLQRCVSPSKRENLRYSHAEIVLQACGLLTAEAMAIIDRVPFSAEDHISWHTFGDDQLLKQWNEKYFGPGSGYDCDEVKRILIEITKNESSAVESASLLSIGKWAFFDPFRRIQALYAAKYSKLYSQMMPALQINRNLAAHMIELLVWFAARGEFADRFRSIDGSSIVRYFLRSLAVDDRKVMLPNVKNIDQLFHYFRHIGPIRGELLQIFPAPQYFVPLPEWIPAYNRLVVVAGDRSRLIENLQFRRDDDDDGVDPDAILICGTPWIDLWRSIGDDIVEAGKEDEEDGEYDPHDLERYLSNFAKQLRFAFALEQLRYKLVQTNVDLRPPNDNEDRVTKSTAASEKTTAAAINFSSNLETKSPENSSKTEIWWQSPGAKLAALLFVSFGAIVAIRNCLVGNDEKFLAKMLQKNLFNLQEVFVKSSPMLERSILLQIIRSSTMIAVVLIPFAAIALAVKRFYFTAADDSRDYSDKKERQKTKSK